ncbi:K(+)-transporting ATPase subunit C [Pseudanabaena sp. BC1403]|uniref:K(+)-transporting ATPase subunit C n=1 Tax=Pseudanabaena sp. BC1403 TaxID=2043171 RepID=UPI000CD83E90|nr:K(+)-transporting ATPase subunit C [Pseudanabaena sp. BC1403]
MNEIIKAIRITFVLWVLVAVIYPAGILAIAQLPFLSNQANGSLIRNAQGQVVGSALIGQPFTSDKYFNSRPSTSSYSTADPKKDDAGILKTGVSGASNLAPSNPDLLKRIKTDISKLQQSGISATADLVYTSGSSLDPHITPESAKAQVARIAQVRKVEPSQLEKLIDQNCDRRFLGVFGEDGVNVLKLNLAIDAISKA